jgi:stage II sporulation protein D
MTLKACFLAILLIGSSLVQGRELPTDFSQKNKPATIKVLLCNQKKEVILEAKGRYYIYNPVDGLQIDSGTLSKREVVHISENGLSWGKDLPHGFFHFRIVPGDSQSSLLVNGMQYRGCLEVYQDKSALSVMNEIDVENYLKATLSPQFPHEKNQELLDAIAITARTNIYYLLSRNPGALWHIEAQDIGYQGIALCSQNPGLDRAIEATRHMILTYHNAPFAATWTKDSAGKTAPFHAIFRKEAPSPEGATATFALHDREKHQWSLAISKEQLAQIVHVKHVNGIDLFIEKTSNKVYALRIHDGLATKDIDFFSLQKALGAHKLRSNDFTIEVKKEYILFTGYGEGHGVGLCLYSAKQMAEHGEKAPKILATFFPQTELKHQREVSPVAH